MCAAAYTFTCAAVCHAAPAPVSVPVSLFVSLPSCVVALLCCGPLVDQAHAQLRCSPLQPCLHFEGAGSVRPGHCPLPAGSPGRPQVLGRLQVCCSPSTHTHPWHPRHPRGAPLCLPAYAFPCLRRCHRTCRCLLNPFRVLVCLSLRRVCACLPLRRVHVDVCPYAVCGSATWGTRTRTWVG